MTKIVFSIMFATICSFFSSAHVMAQGSPGLFHLASREGGTKAGLDRFTPATRGQLFFLDGFETAAPVVTYTDDVQPILGAKCANCHTGAGIGGHNIGTVYEDAFLPATDPECPALNIAQCSLVLIQNGAMPLGGGCTGDPAKDAGNDDCLTQLEQDLIQAWIDMGLLE